jgi:hypothetical protein
LKFLPLYFVELRRLALSKLTWAVFSLCLFAPLFGYSVLLLSAYSRVTDEQSVSMSLEYIANPILAGTVIAAVLWSLLSIFEFDRIYRTKTDVLTDYIKSPVAMSVSKILSLVTIASLNCVLISLIYLPYTAHKLEYLFSLEFYFLNFLILMLPSLIISILFTTAFYQITRRVELTGLLYAGFMYFNFSNFAKDDYFLRPVNSLIVLYSDGFMSLWPLRINLYVKLIWLTFALGLYLLSLLCIRKYQKNLLKSFVTGLKKVYIPIVSVMLIFSGIFLWNIQPFVDNGPYEVLTEGEKIYDDFVFNKNKSTSRFTNITLNIDVKTGKINGKSEYFLNGTNGKNEHEIWLNPGYKIENITYDGKKISFRTDKNSDFNEHRSTFYTLPRAEDKKLTIEYSGFPMQSRAFYPYVSESIDKEYVSLSRYNIFPTGYRNDTGTTFNLTLPDNLIPFLDYEKMTETGDSDGTKTWVKKYKGYARMQLYASEYIVDSFNASGVEIDFAYGKKYEKIIKEFEVENAIKNVFEYATEHYGGMGFTSANYPPTVNRENTENIDEQEKLLLIVKSTVSGRGSAGKGYSECFDTMLSPKSLKDSSKGSNGFESSIHEMLHQWWGQIGLNTSDDGLWSAEALAVYSTYRIVKEVYGELYAEKNYVKAWENAVLEQNRDFYYRNPEYLEKLPEKYQGQLNQKYKSINKYFRMPLMILKAEKLVGGEEKMDEILRSMYENRSEYYAPPYFTYQDFLNACGLTKEDINLENDF